jgi:hypothetical protein
MNLKIILPLLLEHAADIRKRGKMHSATGISRLDKFLKKFSQYLIAQRYSNNRHKIIVFFTYILDTSIFWLLMLVIVK